MARKRIASTFFLSCLFFASLFIGFAQAEEPNYALSAVVNSPENGVWFTPSESLIIDMFIENTQDSTQSIELTEFCVVDLDIFSVTGASIFQSSIPCQLASSRINVNAGEQQQLDDITWDFSNSNGEVIESGVYTIDVAYQELGVSSTTEIQFQAPVNMFEDFALEFTSIETMDGYLENELFIAYLHYLGEESLDITNAPSCYLELTYGSIKEATLPCFPTRGLIMPYEIIPVGIIDPQFESFDQNITLTIQTPGGQQSSQLLVAPQSPEHDDSWSIQFVNTYEGEQSTLQPLEMALGLSHPFDDTEELQFTNSCKTRLDVLNEFGVSVYSSKSIETCENIDLTIVVEKGETESIQMPMWWIQDDNQCSIPSGQYTLIASIPEHGLYTHQQIQLRQDDDLDCGSNQIAFDIEVEQVTIDTMNVEMTLPSAQEIPLRWRTPCAVEGRVYDDQDQVVHLEMMVCDDYDGRLILIPENAPHSFTIDFTMSMIDSNLEALQNGDYSVHFTTTHQFTSVGTTNIEWFSDALNIDNGGELEINPTFDPMTVHGEWLALKQQNNICWILQTEQQQYKLSGLASGVNWAPQDGSSGTYTVVETIDQTIACESLDATPVVFLSLIEEQRPAPVVTPPAQQQNEIVLEQEEILPTVVTGAVAVVVSTSILGLLFAFVAGNESIRIPTTAAGLWFFGLIGKTHETSDGKYQRGRLIGYLTANPGCHFRALMAALEMSNGQITHHIRILEAEERIWRKGDGRLVRYYPYTSHLNPATSEDDLPVPPLSPDPHSLQGKILNLLDQDGQLGDFPTQAELAKRLAKSQQLISHHLRTLQKFGLVEMRKMGIKNRYKLTREAIFLLESTPDFND